MRRRRNQITFKLCVVQRILSMIEINEEIVHIHDTFGPTRTERRLDEKLPITDGLHFCFFFKHAALVKATRVVWIQDPTSTTCPTQTNHRHKQLNGGSGLERGEPEALERC